MPTDPPASDLGALDAATRKRLENVRYPQRAMAMDVRTILAAYDAQAARLAAMEAERDQARTDAADAMTAHGLAVESLRHVEALNKQELASFEARDRSQAARLAEAKTEIARLTAELAECWDQFEKEQEYG